MKAIRSRRLNWLVVALGLVLTLYGVASAASIFVSEVPASGQIGGLLLCIVLAGIGIRCLAGGISNLRAGDQPDPATQDDCS